MKLPNVNLTAVCNYGYCTKKPKYWDTKRMMYVCPDHKKILKMTHSHTLKREVSKNEITRKMFAVLDKFRRSEITSIDVIFMLEPLFKEKEEKIRKTFGGNLERDKYLPGDGKPVYRHSREEGDSSHD